MFFPSISLRTGGALRRLSMWVLMVVVCVCSMQAQTTASFHQKGFSGREYVTVNGHKMQAVHENVQIIYALPNTSLSLQRYASAFLNYYRWYDYDTDAAVSSSELTVDGTQNANGVYGTNGGATATFAFPGTGVRRIACDESNYKDGTGSNFVEKEPTLGHRMVFEIHPASEMANAVESKAVGTDEQGNDKWLESIDMIAPTNQTIFIGPKYSYQNLTENGNVFTNNYFNLDDATAAMMGTESLTLPGLQNIYNANGSHTYTSTQEGWVWYKKGNRMTQYNLVSGQFIQDTHTEAEVVTYELRYEVGVTVTKSYTVSRSGSRGNYSYNISAPQISYSGTASKTYRIAKFTVDYRAKSEVGPKADYLNPTVLRGTTLLKTQDFNFTSERAEAEGKAKSEAPADLSGTAYYSVPFNVGESTFGFVYGGHNNSTDRIQPSNTSGYTKPIYSEYALVNDGTGWQSTPNFANHYLSGKPNADTEKGETFETKVDGVDYDVKKGYAVYVDGAQKPGTVFSLNFTADLCPGAIMYFTAFVGDNNTDTQLSSAPTLDFIVEGVYSSNGKITTDTLTIFTTGAMIDVRSWSRILFPLEFNSQTDYTSFNLRIVNKAASTGGNDFFIDDVAIYLQPAPLTPIEATSPATCLDDNTPLVLYTKIDYARIDGFAGRDYYYRWLDADKNPIDAPYLNQVTDTKGKSAGKITLPNSYTNVGSAPTKATFAAFNESYYNRTVDDGAVYAYIYDASAAHFDGIADARYSAFIATPIPLPATGRCSEYTCVVSLDLETLGSTDNCANSRTIPMTSGMGVHSEAAGATVKGLEQKACANFSYDLTFLVKYVVLEGKDGTTTKESRYKAHWLFGVEPDPTKPAEVAEFQALYGASFAAIKAALEHLNVDAKKDAVSTMTPLENDVYEALKNANGGTYPLYEGSADEKLVNRLVQKGLLVLASSLEDPFKYVVMPLSEQTRLSVTAFPVEKEETYAPDCLTPQSITLTFKNLGPDDKPVGAQDVMTFVKSYTEVVPAFVASRPRRVRVPMYNSARERVSTKDVKVKLTNPGKKYDLGSMYLYSTDDTEATVSSATPTTLVSAAHTGPITGQDAVTFNGLNNLKEGHTYTFKVLYTPETEGTTPSESEVNDYCGGVDPNDPTKLRPGEAFITFVIVPDTLTFVPSEQDGSWDDDYSFRFTDTQKKEYNVAPSQYTSVLFAQGNHILLNRTTNQFQEPGNDRMVDVNALPYITWDIDYEPNVANNIYVPANTSIVGQTNIDAKGTYTFDMPVTPNKWTMTAVPVKGIVTGDMYIPQAGEGDIAYADGQFVVNPISQNSGEWAADREVYSFYNSMYNSQVYHYEGSLDAKTDISSSTWSLATNALVDPLTPGMGWALGFIPADGAEERIVRLPKKETAYNYFRNDTWTGYTEEVDRADAGKPALEFNAAGEMNITLTNKEASEVFLLGNPSFAYLDLGKFATANGLDGTFYLSGIKADNRFNHVTGKFATDNSWLTTDEAADLLAPLQAVLFKATKNTSCTVKFTPDMFVLPEEPEATSAPRRVAAAPEKKIYIAAASNGFVSTALLVEKASASNEALAEEDAEAFLLDSEKTPFAIYTVASNKALAINQINDADVVPLAMFAEKPVAAEMVTFTGDDQYLAEWDLVDNKTNTRWELSDGFNTNFRMQTDGTIRYYLEHARKSAPSVDTDSDNSDFTFGTYVHDGMLTVFSADDMIDFRLYDTAGRLIAAQKNAGRQQDFSLVKGVYVVRANGNTAKVVVK